MRRDNKKIYSFGSLLMISITVILLQGTASASETEAERNQRMDGYCQDQAISYDYGNDVQGGVHCQQAIYSKCFAEKFCEFYPDKCASLESRVGVSCNLLSQLGYRGCPACE